MLSLWRRRNTSGSALDQTHSSTTSFVERKIHPDINLLAEELASSSHGHDPDLHDKAFQAGHPEPLEPDNAGFVGLKPITSRRIQREAYTRANESPTANEFRPGEAEGGHTGAYNDISRDGQKEVLTQITSDIDSSHLSDEVPLVDESVGHTVANPIMRRSTFGKRSRLRHFDLDVEARSAPSSSSNSSLSQSLVTCPSGFPSLDQPDTPGSQPRCLYTSTPRSRSNSSRNPSRGSGIPSPHTFGMLTPPLQPNFKDNDSYFTFKEAPPPLPPLDHPAFRNVSNVIGLSSSRNEFLKILDVDELGRFTRHTHSLPSLTRSQSATRIGSIKTTLKNTRPRSKSSAGTGISNSRLDQLHPEATAKNLNSKTHSRNQSKSSISSSRRSSAEYSAKQVSLISDERVQDGCWEVQVSKEMIRLALGEEVQGVQGKTSGKTQDAHTSAFGKARCKNVGSHAFSTVTITYSPPISFLPIFPLFPFFFCSLEVDW